MYFNLSVNFSYKQKRAVQPRKRALALIYNSKLLKINQVGWTFVYLFKFSIFI